MFSFTVKRRRLTLVSEWTFFASRAQFAGNVLDLARKMSDSQADVCPLLVVSGIGIFTCKKQAIKNLTRISATT